MFVNPPIGGFQEPDLRTRADAFVISPLLVPESTQGSELRSYRLRVRLVLVWRAHAVPQTSRR